MMNILNTKSGIEIPHIGLGTFPFEGRVMADVVETALKIGYRLFDTADDYRGEPGLGIVVKELPSLGLKREDIFLQTKISDNNAHEDEPLKGIYFNPHSNFMKRHSADEIVREKVENSLRCMNTEYLDSLLIHYPFPDYIVPIWKTMIKLKEEGIVRHIGVSNFHIRHIETLIKETEVCPEYDEVYVSPIGIKKELVDYCHKHDCLVMTYSPLMDVAHHKIPIDNMQPIMNKYNKTLAEIVLRWNIERGCLPLPKSKNPKRLQENFDIFDFSLTQEEVDIISALNYDNQYLVESKICPGL
ncbi:MAG: aldo/keto reductase [Prevotella sp.]|jgi:diketogulonate reductase-like aldo/keto reductase|nr:aldo/keto reductase [Prevotella sp.]MCI2088599.1 aldo/keto reductase [Prevotella sp.]MCI2125832.1 aldo/keto reductase [Prevotella sp.]